MNKTIYLVRHGQTVGNIGKFYQHADTPLTEAGQRGAQAVAKRCIELNAEIIISSDMLRAMDTAKAISNSTNLPHEVVPEFHEILQPTALRGKPHSEGEGLAHAQAWRENFFNADWQEEGAENYDDVFTRAQCAAQHLHERIEEQLIVVSHGAFISFFTSYTLLQESGDREQIKVLTDSIRHMSNVGISVLLLEEGKWHLKIYNDHAHFAE